MGPGPLLLFLWLGTGHAGPSVEATPLPYEAPGPYPRPLRVAPAPGYFRPRRHMAGWVAGLAEPPSARWPSGRARGAWIEPPDRPAARIDVLPMELYGGDRVHTGPTGAARVELPGLARIDLGAATILRLAGDGPEPGPYEKVRIGLERGRIRVVTPWDRPLEVEVPFGLAHLSGSEAIFEVPEVHPRPESTTPVRVLVLKGKLTVHGRGIHRRDRAKVGAGELLRYTEPLPRLWDRRRAGKAEVEGLEKTVPKLARQARIPAPEPSAPPEPTPLPVLKPTPGPKPPDPTLDPFLPPVDAEPTKKPLPTKDPFEGDPFDEPF